LASGGSFGFWTVPHEPPPRFAILEQAKLHRVSLGDRPFDRAAAATAWLGVCVRETAGSWILAWRRRTVLKGVEIYCPRPDYLPPDAPQPPRLVLGTFRLRQCAPADDNPEVGGVDAALPGKSRPHAKCVPDAFSATATSLQTPSVVARWQRQTAERQSRRERWHGRRRWRGVNFMCVSGRMQMRKT